LGRDRPGVADFSQSDAGSGISGKYCFATTLVRPAHIAMRGEELSFDRRLRSSAFVQWGNEQLQ
jgi:hypothetical protein